MDPEQRNKIWRTMQANIEQVNKVQSLQQMSVNNLTMPQIPPNPQFPSSQNSQPPNINSNSNSQFESLFGSSGPGVTKG